MVLADVRPDAVDLLFRAGTTVTLTLEWPAGSLTGRTFSSTLDGTALAVTVAGDTMTVEADDTITSLHTTPIEWLLSEDIDGTDEPVLIGTWTPADSPRAVTAQTVQVTEGAATVDLTLTTTPADPRPLASLRTGRPALARGESVSIAEGATEVLADLSGAGVVTSIWMALAFNPLPGDLILRVFVDGEATPAVETDLGSLVCAHYERAGQFSTRNVSVEGRATGQNLGFIFAFPMPYSDGCRVELTNPTGTGGLVIAFWQVSHNNDPPGPYRLRSASALRLSAPTVLTAVDTFEFLDVAGRGVLVWNGVGLETSIPTNGSWTERDVQVFIDGEATPSWQSTGWEDWFGGSFTFQSRSYIGSDFYLVGINNGDRLAAAVDLASWFGGLPFNTQIRVVLDTESSVTTGHSMGWVFLYYLHV